MPVTILGLYLDLAHTTNNRLGCQASTELLCIIIGTLRSFSSGIWIWARPKNYSNLGMGKYREMKKRKERIEIERE